MFKIKGEKVKQVFVVNFGFLNAFVFVWMSWMNANAKLILLSIYVDCSGLKWALFTQTKSQKIEEIPNLQHNALYWCNNANAHTTYTRNLSFLLLFFRSNILHAHKHMNIVIHTYIDKERSSLRFLTVVCHDLIRFRTQTNTIVVH